MSHRMSDIVLLGKEAVARGTEAASYAVDLPFVGNGLDPALTNHLARVVANTTFPSGVQVPVGVTAQLALTPDLNLATIRTLILAATKRTAGVLPSLSIKHSQVGVADQAYLGCVASQMSLQYSRSGSPGNETILQGTFNFECMGPATPAAAVSAGTKGTGHHFALARATVTINSVASAKVLSIQRQNTIYHALGPPDSTNKRIYLDDGEDDEQVTITAQFTSAAWETILLAGTEVTASIVHATGTANETVTETMGAVQIESHKLGDSEGTVTAEIVLKPGYTGTAAATVWTFGSAVGADGLSL